MTVHLAPVCGFCKGVENAVALADKLLEERAGEKCYSIGALVHNRALVEEYEKRGLEVILSPEGHEPGWALVRAHGIARGEAEDFEKAGFHLVDGTCRMVAANHHTADISRHPVIIIGHRGHAEVLSTASHARCGCIVIEHPEEIRAIDKNRTYTVIVQTTFSSVIFNEMKRIFKSEGYKVIYTNNICKASTRRREALVELCNSCDAAVVVGDKHSANSLELFEIARSLLSKVYMISTADEVTRDMADCRNLALTAGASVPFSIIKEVKARLESYAASD